MKREVIVAMLMSIAALATGAEPIPKNTVKYGSENSQYTIYSCEIELDAEGYWDVMELGKDTAQLYIAQLGLEHGAQLPQGKRMRAVEREQNINMGRAAVNGLSWVCTEYAQAHGGKGPRAITDLDTTRSQHVIARLDKSPWLNNPRVKATGPYFFLVPEAEFVFEKPDGKRVTRENRRVLAVELTPFVDDGKHWVAYTDNSVERVAIDVGLVEKYNLAIRPVMTAEDEEAAGAKERTYTVVAVQKKADTRALDLSLRNTLTDETLKLKWSLTDSRDDREKAAAALKYARGTAWRPYMFRSDSPAMKLWAAQELGATLSDQTDRRRRGGDRTASAFGVLGGRAAVRETLQMQAIGGAVGGGDEQTIPVETMEGVTVKSHPYKEMLGAEQGGRLPLADVVPQDRFLVYAAKPGALFPFLDDGAEFMSGAGSVLLGNSIKYDLKARYLARFGLGEKWLRTFLDSGAVTELALVVPDMFFIDGTEVSVVSRLGKPGLIGQMLKLIGVWGLTGDNVVEKQMKTGGVVYWAMRGDLLFVSTSRTEMNSLLALNGNGGAGSLGQSAEFRYMLTQLPVGEDTRAYVYLSDAFIRRLVGPEVKIAQLRRVIARSEMEKVTCAALLARLNGIKPPLTVEALVQNGYLPADYLQRGYVINEDLTVQSKRYGTLVNMATFAETPVTMVSAKEAAHYKQYIANYSRFWRRFFDPIAMRLDDTPDKSLELTTFILPLVDNSMYNALRDALHTREDGRPLNDPIIEPRPVVKLSLNLKEEAWTGISKGLHEIFEAYANVNSAVLDDLGPGFHLAVHDADPVIAIGSGDLMGGFGIAGGMRDAEMLMFPVLLSVLTRPCTLVIETQNPKRTERYLRQAAIASMSGRRRSRWFGLGLHQVTGRDEWVFTMDVEGMIKARFGVQVEGRFLMLRNIPWSSRDRIVEVRTSQLNAARLDAYPGACKLQLAGLHASAADRYRKAAGNSMGYLYPLLASGAADVGNIEEVHKKLFGFRPVHPGTGSWQWNGMELSSSEYGSVLKQTSPPYDENGPAFGALGKIDSLNVSMQFEETGLRTKVRWKTKTH